MNWFYVDHGMDNYEEAVDLDRVVFWRCGWQVLPNSDDWLAEVTLVLDGGQDQKISLTRAGYVAFLKEIGGEALYEKYKASGGDDK